MIHVANLVKTSSFHPAQWQGETDDGTEVYIRYRNHILTCNLGGPNSDTHVQVKLDEAEYEHPGNLSTGAMMDVLADYNVSFSEESTAAR